MWPESVLRIRGFTGSKLSWGDNSKAGRETQEARDESPKKR